MELKDSGLYFVIVADAYDKRKYVAKYPYLWQYSPKLKNARRFKSYDEANKFINKMEEIEKPLENPVVKGVKWSIKVDEFL